MSNEIDPINSSLDEQLRLRIDKEISRQLDSIIKKMQTVAKKFEIAKLDKKSPFRNVLSVAVDSGSSLETIKVYVRYQVGRKESSPIWKHKHDEKLFAEAVVEQINALHQDAEDILQKIQQSLHDKSQLYGYFSDNQRQDRLQQTLHLELAQMYLGYLAREHTALVGEEQNKAQAQDKKMQNQAKSSPIKKQEK